MSRHFLFAVSSSILLVTFCAHASQLNAEIPIINPSFEMGHGDEVKGWELSGGEGRVIRPGSEGQRAICVTGDESVSNAWLSEPLPLESNTLYRLRFSARRPQGTTGLATTGPLFCNRDVSSLNDRWTRFESYFVSPQRCDAELCRLHFGQWEATGEIAYDDIRIDKVLPIYHEQEGIRLGDGELIHGSRYSFQAPFGRQSANHAHPLVRQQCTFNSHRWVFSATDQEVIYQHAVGPQQLTATIQARIGWYRHGRLVISASPNGQQWQKIGTIEGTTSETFDVPASMLPAGTIWVRLTAERTPNDEANPALQVYDYGYSAELRDTSIFLDGATQFIAVAQDDPKLKVAIASLGSSVPGIDNRLVLKLHNRTRQPLRLRAAAIVNSAQSAQDSPQDVKDLIGRAVQGDVRKILLEPGDAGEQTVELGYTGLDVGDQLLRIIIAGDARYRAETTMVVPALHASGYGGVLPASSSAVGLWECGSGWKVSAIRGLPSARSDALTIELAANETEAAQLVVRPSRDLARFQVQASHLKDDNGNRIDSRHVDILRVRYVHVTQPTDSSSTIGLWPDPLPVADRPIDLEAERNHPFWIRVRVPRGTPAGQYRGELHIRAANYQAEVPLLVKVFGFELPDRMSCQTAFGFSPSTVWRYHGLENVDQQRVVLDKYLTCLSDHHISPYDPAPLDPIQLSWKDGARWVGGQRDDTVSHQGHASLKIVDDSTNSNPSAHDSSSITLSGQPLKLSFWHRTAEQNHPFIVTLQHYDSNGKWMSGRNNDMVVRGGTEWQQFEQVIRDFPAGAHTARLQMWAALYREDGSTKGTVWYDDVALVDTSTGQELIRGGSFENSEQPVPKPVFDFAAWDVAMTKAIDHYAFNTFRLGIQGLGGGTFHQRYEPSLQGFSEDTRQYQQAMKSYLEQLEDHLRQQKWLDEAFVYWFDEPAPKDYEFVLNGFSKIERWAPGLRRMLTEQVEPGLIGGPDIWCPLTPAFDLEVATQRRQEGEQFWWYVCTGPKAPYCTLFIDHPATEMRVWLWQTWKRRIQGILVWQTNYWTSSAAYPDADNPQNPYTDPMGWVSGYSTEKGARRPWGNGDGRFIYPPESAANGHPERPVMDGPVSSIRLEMLRDGIEDYEYLVILERLLSTHATNLESTERASYRALLRVPDDISKDLTHFTQDPAPIVEHRRAVAHAIERLCPAR